MVRSALWAAVLVASATLAHAASSPTPPASMAASPSAAALVPAQRHLQEAFDHVDVAAMRAARGQFLAVSAAAPDAAWAHYWVAVADWRLVPMLASKEPATAKKYCEEGIARCNLALTASPGFGEALALKAGLQGVSIRFDGTSAMSLGPQMQANMARAVDLARDNPRVRLLDGINTLHTPAFFGGGPERALEKFEKAQELFADSTAADSTAPTWGRDDAFAWAGRAHAMLGDHAAARASYEQALAINPANTWVRATLLPQTMAALAKEKGK